MEADKDRDGKISFEEFTKMVENTDVSMSMTLGKPAHAILSVPNVFHCLPSILSSLMVRAWFRASSNVLGRSILTRLSTLHPDTILPHMVLLKIKDNPGSGDNGVQALQYKTSSTESYYRDRISCSIRNIDRVYMTKTPISLLHIIRCASGNPGGGCLHDP